MADCILTKDQLAQIIPGNPYLDHWYDALSQALPDYDISTPQRVAAFLAQCAHESGGFTAIKENLNYKSEIANRAYANRMGNGPEESGDGYKFCGRGLIQLTGRSNYQSFADSLQIDINDASEYLKTFEGCVQSACWFWEANNLNKWADAGDIEKMTKIINGGTLGLDDRTNRYNHALQVLGA